MESTSLIPSLRRLFFSIFLFVVVLPILAKFLFSEESEQIEIKPDQVKYPEPVKYAFDENVPDSYEIEELLTTKEVTNDDQKSSEPWSADKIKWNNSKWKSFQGMENPKYKTQPVSMNHSLFPERPVVLSVSWWHGGNNPPRRMSLCPEHLQICDFVKSAITPEIWSRARLGIFHFDRGPPFSQDQLEHMRPGMKEITHGFEKQDFPWAFLSWESPHYHHRDYTEKNGVYNYTMTYRMDSRIPFPYGTVWSSKVEMKDWKTKKINEKRKVANYQDEVLEAEFEKISKQSPEEVFLVPETRNIAKEKVRGVLAVVGNCKASYRWKIMQRVFDNVKWPNGTRAVDFYGGCGSKIDVDNKGYKLENRFFDELLPTYRFYLAIENSKCRDYITEKFWHHCIKSETIGIVGGPPREDYEQLVPPDAFIHVNDEGSVNKTIDIINRLLWDDDYYNKFFEWRNRPGPYSYRFATQEDYGNQGLCRACDIAKNPDKFKSNVPDLGGWWYNNKARTSEACEENVLEERKKRSIYNDVFRK